MTTLARAIAALEPAGGGWRGTVPDNWLQGRTAYGGFSTALALHAAKTSDTDLPPLRSVQVAFVGPLAGTITVTARRLRRGRNAAFVQADVVGDAGLGLCATFVFMTPQASRIDHRAGVSPAFPLPGPDERRVRPPEGVAFMHNFEFVDRRDPPTGPAEWLRWGRLRERDGLDPDIALVAVADGLPPAALKLVGGLAPVSSMTWLMNLVAPPQTREGWWLMRATSDHASAGFSSQPMAIWNAAGAAVAEQMQGVAVFA
nr:thioesterase family protein [Sphingomonas bacterium]